jgi:hypothetical protein
MRDAVEPVPDLRWEDRAEIGSRRGNGRSAGDSDGLEKCPGDHTVHASRMNANGRVLSDGAAEVEEGSQWCALRARQQPPFELRLNICL